jgi:hypothetical protein
MLLMSKIDPALAKKAEKGFARTVIRAFPDPASGQNVALIPSVRDRGFAPINLWGVAGVPHRQASLAESASVVQPGYDPFARRRVDLDQGQGAKAYSAWRQVALRDKTHWKLCETCV